MDIILNTIFNNPNLPVVPIYGFSDDFNRAVADTLGVTAEGKAWAVIDSTSTTSVWGTTGNGTATMKSATAAFHLAVADGLASDGTITAKVSIIGGTDTKRFGLAVRATDASNHIYIAPASSTDHRLRITKRIEGTSTALSNVGPELMPGDTVSVTLNGPSISVFVNGVPAFTVSIPEHVTATKHGFYAFNGSIAEWDYINFVPAA